MEFLAYIITLCIVCLAGFISFFVLTKKNKVLSNKQAILYYLCVGIFISACGFVGLARSVTQSILYFALLQLFFLAVGWLLAFLWKRNSSRVLQGDANKASGLIFVSINAVLGMIGFTILFYYCNPGSLAPYYGLSVVPLVLPQFIKSSFDMYRDIPHEIYKVWYFPEDADEIDFEKVDTSVIYMLELEYSKSIADGRLMNTKLRAPVGMKFGDWFRSFIENYNYKYDSDPINYLNADNTPMGWIFYVKPSFLGTARYIDPDKTISENKLVEKKPIIARRVGLIDDEEGN